MDVTEDLRAIPIDWDRDLPSEFEKRMVMLECYGYFPVVIGPCVRIILSPHYDYPDNPSSLCKYFFDGVIELDHDELKYRFECPYFVSEVIQARRNIERLLQEDTGEMTFTDEDSHFRCRLKYARASGVFDFVFYPNRYLDLRIEDEMYINHFTLQRMEKGMYQIIKRCWPDML